ncbi:MAG: YjgN family protein [Colwellia sp.]|nr:YjgN family protein [Colwellia sp.]MCW8864058.1 YjgN family protein [Colwellia sp.]MCW9081399.1 YjgN family protein [Colwellia sp.]
MSITSDTLDVENNPTQSNKTLGFEFRGDGMEYFKIWIVNILLTIVTLGIYSAWAKVRNNRYFYSNLYLDNDNFRYLADPITILKGRLIALAALIAYYVASIFFPIVAVVLAITLFFAIPYFINQSVAFTNRMSSYKNIQFRFEGSYGQAFMVIYIWPILGMLTLGILYPLALLKANEYFVRNSSYGTSHFDFNATYKDYGMIFLTALGIALAVGVPVALITYFVPALGVISPLLFIVMYFALIVYALVSFTNLFYASLSLVEHKFEANLTITAQAKVILINLLLTIITLGLYLPAAKVRMTKYICSCLTLHASGSLDNFSAAEKENISALGEEFGQVFDFA